MRSSFKIEGLRQLNESLMMLKASTAKAVVRRVLLKAAQPIADDAEQRAPQATGKLKQVAGYGTKLNKRQRRLHKKESPVEVFAGFGSDPASWAQEFGTVNQPPNPFLRPAFDANKRSAMDAIATDLGAEIEKTAKRAARKALKAKG